MKYKKKVANLKVAQAWWDNKITSSRTLLLVLEALNRE